MVVTRNGVEQLVRAVDELWQAVGELALTVYEDRPEGADLAVVDDLAEQVSELQGDVAAARGLLAAAPASLPDVSTHLDDANRRYWRHLRAHAPVAELRRTARHSRDRELPGWQRSVEASAARCEEPLAACAAALQACWREVCGASRPPAPPHPPVPADSGAEPRRSS